ncbi:MAG: hypothetical protein H0T46_02505 [Deltaproteobacteria bacterium]|nr:hypothetical protein [Deltaproteobacteria bacterium]
MEPLSPDHPQINLLFAIDGEPSDADARAMQDLVEALVSSKEWTLSPPEFVNEEDDSSDDPEDKPIITVGGVMRLYSSFPPWDDKVPAAVDRAQYDEVVEIVERLTEFSLSRGVDIVFEYDGEVVGKIRKGLANDSLSDGLLGEWGRTLERDTR